MKKIFKRRGQASVEFALILPIFALLLFALVQLGFLFIDVVTLDSAVSAAARSAAISNDGEPSAAVIDKIKKTTLFQRNWYTIKDGENLRLRRILDTENPDNNDIFFTYAIQAERITDNSVLKMFLPEHYTVKKTAYKEEEP